MKADRIYSIYPKFAVVISYLFCAIIFTIAIPKTSVLATNSVLVSNNNDSQVYINSTTDIPGNDSTVQQHPQLRNVLPDSFFCGPIIGSHYMFGSASTYCGGFAVTDCSAQCFYRNFTYFQCEGFVCHCYSR